MISKNVLWLVPFLCFLSGYMIVSSLFHINTISTPSVVGKHLYDAFAILSNHHLNVRLLAQKEDADLPNGTVINQVPSPGQMVKPRQTVFLALSKQPPIATAPQLIGKQHQVIKKEMLSAKLRFKAYFLESPYPANTCIAQIPSPHKPLSDNILIVYLSKGSQKPIIWPNFSGKPVDEVIEFLAQYQITPNIIKERPESRPGSDKAIVTDQRPLAGSLVTLDPKQLPIVQLYVK